MGISGVVFDIKKYSIHDGPGLRTTVHLKGCPLSCWWCHNPESISVRPAVLFRAERCIGCGKCANVCSEGAIAASGGGLSFDRALCVGCGACEEACPAGARDLCGREMTVESLMDELRRDEIFFREGGVTFSGGEPLMQPDFLIAALEACGLEGYHRTVDTCGFVQGESLLEAGRNAELFLYDLKHMDSEKHKLYTGVGNEIILENLVRLTGAGAAVNIRFPFMPGINSDDRNAAELAAFVSGLKGIISVSILPYHTVAKGKHDRWGMEYRLPDMLTPAEHQLRRAARVIESYGLTVNIGG